MTSRISIKLFVILLVLSLFSVDRDVIAGVSGDGGLPLAQLQPLNGSTDNFAVLHGKPVILQFWASWCHSCSSIMFDLDDMLQQFPGTDYLAVSLDDETDDALQYIQKHALYEKYSKQYFIDTNKSLATKLGVETVPTVVLLDADGNEVVRRSGHLNSSDLQQLSAGLKSIQAGSAGENGK
jgi:thiol-disulfide isomerase/thioredoxin